MKICSACKTEKPLSNFSIRKASQDGYTSACKTCVSLRRKSYESEKRYNKNYYLANKEASFQRKELWYKANPDKKRIHRKNYRTNNLEKVRLSEYTKYLSRKTHIPTWLSEVQRQEIASIYSLRAEVELLTGERYHVDHIVPLQGKDVCGLHVPWNLQILPATLNLSKGNKFELSANTGAGAIQ